MGLDPDQLPPRDRQQFWYNAIARAGWTAKPRGPQAMRWPRHW